MGGGRNMFTRVAMLVWMAVASGALAAAESRGSVVAPVFHELVGFSLPAEFKSATPAYERDNGSFYSREYVPPGESVDRWTQMLTLTGVKDLAANPNATPRAFVSSLANGFKNHCPDTFATAEIGAQQIGAHTGFAIVVSCGHVQSGSQAFSETAVMLAVKGSNDIYSIEWARRGSASSAAPKLDASYWSKQLERLQPVRLCPIVPGEAAPFPSCAER
jgi:hypothetical protein